MESNNGTSVTRFGCGPDDEDITIHFYESQGVLTSFLLSVCPMSLSVLVLPFPVSFVVLFPQAVIPASNTANASVIHTLLIFLIFKISFP